MSRIYLDHNAATPVEAEVLRHYIETERHCPANPGSLHTAGRRARAVLEQARSEVATALAVPAATIVFVSGGTEANNAILRGSGDLDRPVLLAPLEHPSALAAAERRGAVWWTVDDRGHARVAPVDEPIGLLCLVHGQNEVGTLQPIEDARALASELSVPLHVDASQTLGRVDLEMVVRAADSLTLSAHKAGGLRGGSALFVRDPESLRPLLVGGAQEGGLRAGTPSPALAAATARAISLAVAQRGDRCQRMTAARRAFELPLDRLEGCRKLTPADALPNTVMFLFEGIDGRNLLPALDMAGIECSQGSACSAGAPTPPRVLAAMGLDQQAAACCVRFSVSHHTLLEDAARAGAIVARVTGELPKRTTS